MSPNASGGLPARQMLALLVMTVLVTGVLVLVAVHESRDADDPPATEFSGRQAPFRGNRLPDGVRDKTAPHTKAALRR